MMFVKHGPVFSLSMLSRRICNYQLTVQRIYLKYHLFQLTHNSQGSRLSKFIFNTFQDFKFHPIQMTVANGAIS